NSGYGRFNQHEPIRHGVGSHSNQKRVFGVSKLGPLRGRLGRSNTTLQTISLRNNDL
ncbi:hypothetical protein PoB_004973600, partial [Plakobranchus ocellatus]